MSDTIYITGGIYYPEDVYTDSKDYDLISPKAVRDQIAKISSNDVILQVGSDGGDIVAALEIYRDLLDSGLNISTIGVNRIGSAGTVLFLLPDEKGKRKVVKGAKSYIHAPVMTTIHSNFIAHIENAKTLSFFTEMFAEFYSQKLGITEDEALEYMISDTVWSDQEMVKNNMCSEILDIPYKGNSNKKIEMRYSDYKIDKGIDIIKSLIKTK